MEYFRRYIDEQNDKVRVGWAGPSRTEQGRRVWVGSSKIIFFFSISTENGLLKVFMGLGEGIRTMYRDL